MAHTTGMFLGGSPFSGRLYPCPLSGYPLRSLCVCLFNEIPISNCNNNSSYVFQCAHNVFTILMTNAVTKQHNNSVLVQ